MFDSEVTIMASPPVIIQTKVNQNDNGYCFDLNHGLIKMSLKKNASTGFFISILHSDGILYEKRVKKILLFYFRNHAIPTEVLYEMRGNCFDSLSYLLSFCALTAIALENIVYRPLFVCTLSNF